MNGLLGGKNPPVIERIFRPGSNELCSLEESVGIINDFFAQVGDRVASNLDDKPFLQRDDQPPTLMENFSELTEAGLIKILADLSTKKSSGICEISTGVLVDTIRARPDIFVKLCNRSLETGVFPDHCKVARIKVIPKQGVARLLDNL